MSTYYDIGVGGVMSEFCLVAALIVALDCLFLFTYFVSVLTLKLEVLSHLMS